MGEELKTLIKFGADKIKFNSSANNYYINFNLNNKKHTIEHVLNLYGVDVDYWELYPEPVKRFNSLEESLEWLKSQQ